VGYCAVGDVLRLQNGFAEATEYYQKALQHDPNYARAYSNLGLTAEAQGRLDEAIAYYQHAIQLDPNYPWAHYNLGNVLRLEGWLDEAYYHCQQAIQLDPKNGEIKDCLTGILLRQGRGQEVLLAWQKNLAAKPAGHNAWLGYPELCLYLGQPEDYRRARQALLNRFAATTAPYIAEPIGRACLLLPAAGDELREAGALVDRAVAAKESTVEWIFRYFLFAKGLAEYRRSRLASAISVMQGEASKVMGPCPRLVEAMAQHDQGQKDQARKTLARAIASFDWSATQADKRDVWICHVLRREAETRILPNLPAFLRGEYQPLDNDERLGLAGICQFQGRYHAAAQLSADAFATDPALAENLSTECRCRVALGDAQPFGRVEELTTECRYPAARCAALAGRGLGLEGAKLSEAERGRWRKQARDWLRADLEVWAKILDSRSRTGRLRVRQMLIQWQADPDLAGLRKRSALDKLSADERKECLALWKEVALVLNRACTAQ
jgi:serine/threonine-protein kinase